jgi:type II secretory pathway component GspD/PulD (secretin)
MSVTPRLQQGTDKLLLEYSLSLNDVENIESFTTGTGPSAQTIQLPTTTVKNILQRASLRSGQTLVLSGFKQSTNSILKSGLGSANNQLLGGGNNGKNSSQYLVITVTPYIAQDNE